MIIDPKNLPAPEKYQFLIGAVVPRAIAWVSTVNKEGRPNLAPFSFFTGITSNPLSVLFCPSNNREGKKKDTLINVEETGEFVVNVVTEAMAQKMNLTSGDFPSEINEFEKAGLTAIPSQKVKPPRVAESPIHMEGKVSQIVRVGEGALAGNVVIGEIVLIHIEDGLYTPGKGFIDPEKLKPVGRMGSHFYVHLDHLFEMKRPVL